MQSQNRLLDDLARVASGALGVATGMRSEVEARLREQFERIIQQMDLVTREDYDVVLAMAQKAREDQEDLAERVEKLEAKLAALERGGGKAAGGSKSAGGTKSAGAKSAGTTRKSARGGAKKGSGGSSGGSKAS